MGTGQHSRQQQLKTQHNMKLFKMLLPLLLVATCSGFSLNALLGGSAEEEPAVEQEVEEFEEDLEEEDMEEEDEEEDEEVMTADDFITRCYEIGVQDLDQ